MSESKNEPKRSNRPTASAKYGSSGGVRLLKHRDPNGGWTYEMRMVRKYVRRTTRAKA